MDSGSQVLCSSLCQWNLDPGFQSLVGFRITWVIFWIPKPRSPDSKSKTFPDTGFPYEGDSKASRKHKPDENKTRLIFPQPPCFIDHHRSVIMIRLYYFTPGSDSVLLMSRTYHIELSTWTLRRLNQLGTPVSIWNGSAVLSALPGREFRLWIDFATPLIQTQNFSVPNLMNKFL